MYKPMPELLSQYRAAFMAKHGKASCLNDEQLSALIRNVGVLETLEATDHVILSCMEDAELGHPN
jgi:hypothetical protein